MDYISSEKKNVIIKEGLKDLQREGYISSEEFERVYQAQSKFYIDQTEQKTAELQKKHEELSEGRSEAELQKDRQAMIEDRPKGAPIAPPKPKKEKKVLSPQEVRERNITWSLNLGVIMLLIGGLVLATSTWETLDSWMKTGLVALVSILFFGLAYFSSNVLKINKTTFAFYVLGSLFLPIVILSAGYFELFGAYFSVAGEGRYILGAAGSLAILPVYLSLSKRLSSRLFVWFSYITFSLFAGFAIAAMYLPVDGFYLGIMLFNAMLIIGYRFVRNNEKLNWISKEFVSYIQANLILSTLLMLVFYNQELFYSFNLILTAVLYMSMIYVTNRKEYHFVFSAMLVYGAYQLIEHSILDEFGSIFYALLGVLFLVLPNFLSDQFPLKKVFRYTSAFVSGCAFIYISFEGILIKLNEPSFALMVAYIIISMNFIYLSNVTKQRLFMYLSPVFLISSLYEVILLGEKWMGYNTIELPLFIAAFLLYCLLGCYNKLNFFKNIEESTRDVSALVMGISILYGIVLMNWWQSGTMFLLFSIAALLADQFEKRKTFKVSAPWIHAISFGLAIVMFIEQVSNFYTINQPFEAVNFIGSGIALLLGSAIWKVLKRDGYSTSAFFVSQVFYGLGLVASFSLQVDLFLRAIIVLGGVGMALLLYQRTKWIVMPYVISGLSLLSYLTLLLAIHSEWRITSDILNSLQYVFGGALLFIIGLIIMKKAPLLTRGFWWIGHLYLPVALLASYFFYGDHAIWPVLLTTIIYGTSLYMANEEWKIKTFLYASLTSFTLFVHLIINRLDMASYDHYAYFISSVLMMAAWYLSRGEWPRRIAIYLVPFSLISIVVYMGVYPFDLDTFVLTLVSATGVLFIMHKEKWDLFSIVPLLMVYSAVRLFGQSHPLWEHFAFLAYSGLAVLLTIVGMTIYKWIYDRAFTENKWGQIDWYTIFGLFTLVSLYIYSGEALWTKLLPGLLISVWLFLQRNRIVNVPSKWLVFIAIGYLIQPYYALLNNGEIPVLFEREFFVLPWVALAIYLKKVTEHKLIANRIQWAVLIIVSLLLVQDGMASSTVYDAIIVGTLSLASMLGGMAYRIKSFFFVGAGVLLLNLFLQTRPFWGNMPWWVYLLIGGSVLIAVASYNEWHKQKTSDGKETLLTKFNKKIIQRIKSWE
ncbi:hypothetical protein [Pseudalkalibacillus berkeleyi]|uniref:DUF2157 domain-containing protein n=1 Tax=Pseudalkalibacillus berkeleyi TaxID=1069813 RepID=A0ABS9H4U1_9BACL|nr:hypothetical protein [Pseudalkalibacillus berkeleyi]MCF6138847.1 hypothetical protein [Pseudalkalibacillus berkeleyi]